MTTESQSQSHSQSMSAPAPITVVVVDDHPLLRRSLAMVINNADGLRVVGEAGDGVEAIEVVGATAPDVVLMDVRMPHLDGIAATRRICESPTLRSTRVLVLSMFELDEYVFEALRHGASGFLLKDAEPARLLEAVRVVAAGGSLLAPSVTRRVIEEFGSRGRPARPHPRLGDLTRREREIVAWVATGRSNQEIAGQLFLSADTVRTHVSRAMVKLHARDRAQLVVFAIESGLVP